MSKHRIHAVAILNEKGEIFSNLSAKDIKLMETDALFTKLYKPALELVQLIRAKNLRAYYPSFCVTADTILEDVIKKLVVCNVHRLYVEDEFKKPIGVISLGDILSLLVNLSPQESR